MSAAEWERTARNVEAVINDPPSPGVTAWLDAHDVSIECYDSDHEECEEQACACTCHGARTP